MRTKKVLAIIALLVVAGAWIYRSSVFRPAMNFHVVEEGRFYRMAQPTPDELEDLKNKYGIKTIINLRGHQSGEWWYDDESKAAQRLGLKLVDIGFSTEDVQNKEDWVRYLETLETAERPILVHCRSGADRTSEASAIYEIEYMKRSVDQAISDQMGLAQLHVPFFIPAKTEFVKHWKGAEWLRKDYDPCAPEFKAWSRIKCAPSAPAEVPAKPDVKNAG